MFFRYFTKAIVLKSKEFLEKDKIYIVFSYDFGKLELLGRGIRKINSKLKSAMEPLSFSEIEFIQGKNQKTLTDARLIEDFGNLKKDLRIFRTAYKIVELAEKLTPFEQKDENIWLLLEWALKLLNKKNISLKECFWLYQYFLWNFLSLLGYRPELSVCSSCGKELLNEKIYFSFLENGFLCFSCYKKEEKKEEKNIFEVQKGALKVIKIILKSDWFTLKRIKISSLLQKSLKEISGVFLNIILEENQKKEKFAEN